MCFNSSTGPKVQIKGQAGRKHNYSWTSMPSFERKVSKLTAAGFFVTQGKFMA